MKKSTKFYALLLICLVSLIGLGLAVIFENSTMAWIAGLSFVNAAMFAFLMVFCRLQKNRKNWEEILKNKYDERGN